MRIKSLAAALAASSLVLATPALAADAAALKLSPVRAAAAQEDESNLMDSGFIGFAIVFGAGALVGALLYSVIKGGDDEEPVSP